MLNFSNHPNVYVKHNNYKMPKYRSLPIEKERMLTHLYDAKMKELPDERQGTAL